MDRFQSDVPHFIHSALPRSLIFFHADILFQENELRYKNIKMDTDELSRETYRAILTEAEKFNHDLTLQFGLLSGDCKDEEEFIEKSTELIRELKIADPEDLDDIFFGNVPNVKTLYKTLDKILNNVASL
ncbi:MAG: hypothetical protein WKF87_16475 [Chryseolinea sp.]